MRGLLSHTAAGYGAAARRTERKRTVPFGAADVPRRLRPRRKVQRNQPEGENGRQPRRGAVLQPGRKDLLSDSVLCDGQRLRAFCRYRRRDAVLLRGGEHSGGMPRRCGTLAGRRGSHRAHRPVYAAHRSGRAAAEVGVCAVDFRKSLEHAGAGGTADTRPGAIRLSCSSACRGSMSCWRCCASRASCRS